MKYHLQAEYEKKRLGDYNSMVKKIDDILSMDESQIILSYGKNPFGLNYLSEYGLKSFIEME